MDAVTLARMVKDVRGLQKKYFHGGRDPRVLQESKDAERKLDQAVADILSPKAAPQPGLFDDAELATAKAAVCSACSRYGVPLAGRCPECGGCATVANKR